MKCPFCNNRIARATAEGLMVFSRRMLMRASDSTLILFCNHCNKPIEADEALRKAFSSALLLKTAGGSTTSPIPHCAPSRRRVVAVG